METVVQISLKTISAENWRAVAKLIPAPGQEAWIEPNELSLVEAGYITSYKPLAIYADETLVGFLMYFRESESGGHYWLDRFMIDAAHQGKGLGRAALTAFLARITAYPDCTAVSLTYIPGNAAAAKLYASAGFVDTGETDENGEIVMRLEVTRPSDEGVLLHLIDRDNWQECIALSVDDTQKNFVASNLRSLLEARFNPLVFPHAIYAQGQMVGFVMYGGAIFEPHEYRLWYVQRLMIDQRYQGKGYGRAGLMRVIEKIKAENPEADGLCISYVPENIAAGKLYASMGFLDEGTRIETEILTRLPFR